MRESSRPATSAMETLAGVLDGEILVQNHCYRADEMAIVLDMGKEFGYKVSTFHHGVEAYKIGDLLRCKRYLQRGLGRLVGLQDGSL
jgi:imidazolonepropionase-like amidohydrolase